MSTEYDCPPVKPPLVEFPARSVIPVPDSLRSSLKVPLPLIELTVTSIVVPLTHDTDVTVPEGVPVKSKSLTSTPLTASLKVTLYVTVAEFVLSSAGFCLLIEITEGAIVSIVYVWPPV